MVLFPIFQFKDITFNFLWFILVQFFDSLLDFSFYSYRCYNFFGHGRATSDNYCCSNSWNRNNFRESNTKKKQWIKVKNNTKKGKRIKQSRKSDNLMGSSRAVNIAIAILERIINLIVHQKVFHTSGAPTLFSSTLYKSDI